MLPMSHLKRLIFDFQLYPLVPTIKILLFGLLFCPTLAAHAIDDESDSLIRQLTYEEVPEHKISILIKLSRHYGKISADSALIYAEQAILLSNQLENDSLLSSALNQLGNVYTAMGKYHPAVKAFKKAADYATGLKDEYDRKGRINNNLGMVYYYLDDREMTFDYFGRAADQFIQSKDTVSAVTVINNLAGVYLQDNQFQKALEYFKRGYQLAVAIQHKSIEGVLLSGMGSAYISLEEYDKALPALIKSLKIKETLGNKVSTMHSISALGDCYYKMEKYDNALFYFHELEAMSEGRGFLNLERKAYDNLYLIYRDKKQFRESLDYYTKRQTIIDSIFTAENIALNEELKIEYQRENHLKELELLKKSEIIKQKEIDEQDLFILILIAGGFLIILFSGFIYYRLRDSKKKNLIIREQKKIVEFKNDEITSSINYAKRIQQAMLSSEDKDADDLPDHFIFFKPKDIVSGDFYWISNRKDYFYLAVVDCTGHGVPGAFLTMLGTAFLNEIVGDDVLISPSQILDLLRNRIIKELRQSIEDTKTSKTRDGMDISLIRINKSDLSAEWAGANNPLWILRAGSKEIEELKGDKQPIGISFQMDRFSNHKFNLAKGDRIYLFSDGYVDQFGIPIIGSKAKKYRAKQLKQLFELNKSVSLVKQQVLLDTSLLKWMGSLDQIDDICVIGMEL